MRMRGRIDANQPGIVKGLRQAHCSVQSLAAVGDGCADLLVGRNGRNYVLEVKDPSKPPSARALTPAQKDWHREWNGAVFIVETLEEALHVVEVIP